MNICPACVAAQKDHEHGIYYDGCEGCNVRGIALSPKFVRERWYDMTREKSGPEAETAMKQRVSAEWGRIQRLKARSTEC